MSSARITRPRRIFIQILSEERQISFSDLKRRMVGQGENQMDLTTLYRMIDVFQKQGIIHIAEHNNEKIIFLAGDFDLHKHSVEIIVCHNCNNVFAEYADLPKNCLSQTIYTHCSQCKFCH